MDCSRCGGEGHMSQFHHVAQGVCFRCKGERVDPKLDKILGALNSEMERAKKDDNAELVEFFAVLSNQVGKVKKDMSGTIDKKNMGQKIPVLGPKGGGFAYFGGYVRKDKQKWWEDKGNAVQVHVQADTFIEGQVTFKVPGGKLEALGIRKEVFIRRSGDWQRVASPHTVRVITRNPMNQLEKSLNDRWPLVIKDGEVHQFTHKDIICGAAQQELPL